jgi:hypothetical protein
MYTFDFGDMQEGEFFSDRGPNDIALCSWIAPSLRVAAAGGRDKVCFHFLPGIISIEGTSNSEQLIHLVLANASASR